MREIVTPLLVWYEKNKRVLPWRGDNNPYHIWISEIMLQQTRVEAVKGYYARFLERLPDVQSLAQVPEDELMKLWQGLGYYNRARNLQRAARVIQNDYRGEFPQEYEELLELPGIGAYTAGAIASIAFGKKVPAVDGNVYRIVTRLQADGEDITKGKKQRQIREQVAELVPETEAGAFNQALMDLGAGVCIPIGEPLCAECPLQEYCKAHESGNPLDYPFKPGKKSRRIEEKTVFILEHQGKYLLQKRPEKGLLAGLWEFPSQEGRLSVEQVRDALTSWNVSGEEMELLGPGKHIFSHIEWHMLGYLVHLDRMPEGMEENFSLVSTEEMREEYSIPSAFSVYLKRIMEE